MASSALAFSDSPSSALISVTNAPISVGTSAAVTKPPFSSVCSHVSPALFFLVVCKTGRSRQFCTGPLSSPPRKLVVFSSRRHEGADSLDSSSSSSGTSCGSSTPDHLRLVFSASDFEANLVSSVVVGPSKSPNAIVCSAASILTGSDAVGVSTNLSLPTTIGSGVAGRLNDKPPSGEPAVSAGSGAATETGAGANDKTSAG